MASEADLGTWAKIGIGIASSAAFVGMAWGSLRATQRQHTEKLIVHNDRLNSHSVKLDEIAQLSGDIRVLAVGVEGLSESVKELRREINGQAK